LRASVAFDASSSPACERLVGVDSLFLCCFANPDASAAGPPHPPVVQPAPSSDAATTGPAPVPVPVPAHPAAVGFAHPSQPWTLLVYPGTVPAGMFGSGPGQPLVASTSSVTVGSAPPHQGRDGAVSGSGLVQPLQVRCTLCILFSVELFVCVEWCVWNVCVCVWGGGGCGQACCLV
jgi:hypothetical protein